MYSNNKTGSNGKASSNLFGPSGGSVTRQVRDKSEKSATQNNRETYKKLNTVKRISRNSIVLFSFTGRNKNKGKEETAAKGSSAQASAAKEEQLLKSGSTKNFKDPQIGKLDFIPPAQDGRIVSKQALRGAVGSGAISSRAVGGESNVRVFEDSIEAL